MPFLIAGISLLFVRGVNNQLMNAAFDTYDVLAGIIVGLAFGTAMFRLFINHIIFGGYSSLKEIFKNTITFIVCLGIAPTVIKVGMSLVDEISTALVAKSQYSKTANLIDKAEAEKIINQKELSIADFLMGPKLLNSATQDMFQWGVRCIVISIATLLEYLRNLVFAMLVAAIPVFLYIGLMFDIKFYSQSVISFGVTLLIWPLLSAILLYFSVMVFKSESESYWNTLSQNVTLLIYSLAQLLLPYFSVKAGIQAASSVGGGLKSMGSLLLKTGGKSI